MIKLRYIVKTIVFSIVLLITVNGFAQSDRLIRAQQLYNKAQPLFKIKNVADEKNAIIFINEAKSAIDSVVVNTETKADYASWSTRAFIYFEIYKLNDKQKLNSSVRDTLISSILMSNKLKPDADYESNNKKLLISVSIGYYNLSKKLLEDSLNEKRSALAYNKYKQTFLIAEPKANFLSKDIEYYTAVGSFYANIYNKDNKNTQALDISKVALLKVLELQQDNQSANMNMGIMYYNQAVKLIESIGIDNTNISQLDIIQENMVKLAKQAEQFILKVYKVDQKNPKSVEALYYIYRMLNDDAKFNDFKNKCKELGIKTDK